MTKSHSVVLAVVGDKKVVLINSELRIKNSEGRIGGGSEKVEERRGKKRKERRSNGNGEEERMKK